ncbi:MAG: J domain-containing protein, partial [Deltaproteobacteria bacterium]|nr:J domain-containing protein [Deltaproteobacteria bacterium]
MEIDAIEGLVALGLVSSEQAAAAQSVPDASLGRLGRLALVGVDVNALLPTLAAFARMPLATAEHLQAGAAPPLAPAAQSALAALPACPVLRPDGSVEVVLSDPKVRPQVAAVMGPMFRGCLAAEEPLRALCARLLTAAAPVTGAAPAASVAPASSPVAAAAPRAPTVANHEMAAFVEAPRARAAGLSGAALAAALAEPVDLSDAAKRRILELDARIDSASPAELLGVTPGKSANDIKERYYELSREFHPDAHFR